MVCGAWIEGIGWVDSAWIEDGFPTCCWDRAPAGVATRRQLRELGLAPGGLLHAWLYRLDVASLKRQATPAVLTALAAAMRARRTCPSCGRDTGCCVPRSLGQCWDCHLLTPTRLADQSGDDAAWAVVVGAGGGGA